MSGAVPDPDPAVRASGLEGRIARLLRAGTYLAIALVTVGVVLMLASGRSPLDLAPGLVPGALAGDLVALRAAGFLWAGLLVVLLTPAARVAVSMVGFARAGDRFMSLVAGLVLAVVIAGVIAGVVAGRMAS